MALSGGIRAVPVPEDQPQFRLARTIAGTGSPLEESALAGGSCLIVLPYRLCAWILGIQAIHGRTHGDIPE